jgi:hypothetical protein
MVRTLTSPTTAKVALNQGVEPITVVKVEWSGGTVYYADRAITISGITCVGGLLECSALSSQEKADNVGEVTSASIKLDDSDGALRTIVKTKVLERTVVTVYQYFSGLASSDLLTVLKGKIITPVEWDEGERTLSLQIETYIEDDEVGFCPSDLGTPFPQIVDLDPAAEDTPWPLCFGTVIKVPAVQVRDRKSVV